MIIDAHCHLLPPSFADRRLTLAAADATFAEMLADPSARTADTSSILRAMDRDGIDHAVVMGMGWETLDLAIEANDYIVQAVDSYPDRLSGFASLNPKWGDAAVAELERCARAGLRGIGELHPDTQGFDIADLTAMSPIMESALSLELPVLVHCSEPVGHSYPGKGKTTPDKVWKFIGNFPENVIICAHWGGGLPFYSLMPEVGAALGNVYFDSAASPFLYQSDVYSAVANLVGADCILFASDYPLMPPRRPLSEINDVALSEQQRRLILGENAARLLGIELL